MKEYSKLRSTAANEARMAGIQAKKTAVLVRVRELLSTLPPEVAAKLDQKELSTGVAVMTKKKVLDNRAVIQSPSDGMYTWNGSNVMNRPQIRKRIAQLAMSQSG
jgi:adenylate kinase